MSPRGGKREGAGRPSRKLPTTKISVYKETHELINKYAKEFDIPVVELMYYITENSEFDDFMNKVRKSKEEEKKV